jgi:hypothetical protein
VVKRFFNGHPLSYLLGDFVTEPACLSAWKSAGGQPPVLQPGLKSIGCLSEHCFDQFPESFINSRLNTRLG